MFTHISAHVFMHLPLHVYIRACHMCMSTCTCARVHMHVHAQNLDERSGPQLVNTQVVASQAEIDELKGRLSAQQAEIDDQRQKLTERSGPQLVNTQVAAKQAEIEYGVATARARVNSTRDAASDDKADEVEDRMEHVDCRCHSSHMQHLMRHAVGMWCGRLPYFR